MPEIEFSINQKKNFKNKRKYRDLVNIIQNFKILLKEYLKTLNFHL